MSFCPFSQDMPVLVEVKDGEIVLIQDAKGISIKGEDLRYEFVSPYATIEKVFNVLEAGIKGEADQVTVTYDPMYGFPTKVDLDYFKEFVDDELGILISSIEPLR